MRYILAAVCLFLPALAVAQTPPTWQVTWLPPTTYTDGTPLTEKITYRLESAPSNAGPWASALSVSAPPATLSAPSPQCFRVVAVAASGVESQPSASVCASMPTSLPPSAPGAVGEAKRELWLVAGTTGGMRAVYSRTASISRGPKLGELSVGPVNGDFERVECDGKDTFTYGGNRYAHVIAQGLDGYVSGCASVGMH